MESKSGMKTIFLFLVFLFSGSMAGAVTLSQIRTEVRRALRDNPSDSTLRRYSDSVLLDYVNAAQREMVNTLWLADKTTSYVLSPLTTYYNLPDDFLVAHQVYFTDTFGQTTEMDEVLQRSLYDNNPSWDRNNGQPIEYWVSGSTNPQSQQSAPLRISYIPIPTYTSTGVVTAWYYSTVPDLSSDSDVPFENRKNLTNYHYALIYHVISRIKLIEGKGDEAVAYQNLYQAYTGQAQSNLGRAPNFNPGISIPSTNRR